MVGRSRGVIKADAHRPLVSRESQRWVFERYSADPAHVTDELIERCAAIAERLGTDGICEPVLVIWGRNYPSARLKRGIALFGAIARGQPKAALHVLNQAGHLSMREQPAAFNGALRGFIAAMDPA